jgi:hypothetical protein
MDQQGLEVDRHHADIIVVKLHIDNVVQRGNCSKWLAVCEYGVTFQSFYLHHLTG